MTPVVPVSVVIPTWNRTDQLAKTLGRIYACHPLPAEVLVHVDAGDDTTESVIARDFPDAIILTATMRTGAVGGRRKLMQRAGNELVVGLDDDSWPIEADFFGQVVALFDRLPQKCALVACSVIHQGEEIPPRTRHLRKSAAFIGCGAIFRRSVILEVGGYIPVVYGHGFEETDLALRLWDSGYTILESSHLRVFHDTDLSHHVSPAVNGAQITNLALVAFLRYPLSLQWYGLLQILNRIVYAIRMKRFAGIIKGLCNIPGECWRLRDCRFPVHARTVRRFKGLSASDNN